MTKREFTFHEKMKLFQQRHKKHALRDSLITLAVLSIPLFGWSMFVAGGEPQETREDDVEYRMSMVGDMLLGRHVLDAANQQGEDISRVFRYVEPFFEDSDFTTGNFENPVIGEFDVSEIDERIAEDDIDIEELSNSIYREEGLQEAGFSESDIDTFRLPEDAIEEAELYNKDIHFYAEPNSIDALIDAGFDSVNLANNHMLDYGSLSAEQTLAHFKDHEDEIDTHGIGDLLTTNEDNVEEDELNAGEVKTYDIDDDTTMGIVGITDVFVQGFSASDTVSGVFTTEYVGLEVLRSQMNDVQDDVDILAVHIHWGDEYQVGYNEEQEELADFLANNGADLIIGHHSHVLEPVTIEEGNDGNNTLVINSLGNFVFDQGWSRTKESAIAQLDFLEDGSRELSFVPMRIQDTIPRETAGPLKPYYDYRIFRTLRKELDRDLWDVENDRLVIDLDAAGVLD
ncbi:CapA family protein [Alkalicoccus chagannorensis]|uniref:CapA family protein n=1 Tax=Alkalicoccus chagannorensis TaxID=427072 RepID=UPI00041D504A|nr:CapA family protein [Alkalicoccus chagannorensis]